MQRFRIITVLLLCGMIICPMIHGAEKIIGKVSAANLNVRVKPSTKFTAVCRLKYGDEVEVIRKQDEWLEIVAPANSSVWVSAFFVKDGKTTSEVKLRSGPGIAYKSYRTVPAGQEVKIINDANPDWKKIEPLPSLSAWTSAQFVKISPEDMKKLTAPEAPKPPEDKLKPEDKAAEDKTVKEVELPFVAGYDKQVEYTGTIWPLEEQGKYVTHALVDIKDNKAVPVCYLRLEVEQPDSWAERKVKVKGTQRLVKDWKLPVVIVGKDGITAVEK